MKRIIGLSMIVMGALMIALWSFFLWAGMVPELQTVPLSTAAHLAAGYSSAFLLIFSGILLIQQKPQSEKISLVGLGMYTYAVIQASGYYLQQGAAGFVIMFTVFFLLGLVGIKFLIHSN
jgi:hypothetical protein